MGWWHRQEAERLRTAGLEEVTLREQRGAYRGGKIDLTVRNGIVVGAMGSDPKRYVGLPLELAREYARTRGGRAQGEALMSAKQPSKRELAIARLRIAGYDDDRKTWMRTYVENRIGYAVAQEAWQQGVALRQAGVPRS